MDRGQLPERLRPELRPRGPGDLRHDRRGGGRNPRQRKTNPEDVTDAKSARIADWGHGTAGLSRQAKFDRSHGQPYVFPHVRQVVKDAFRRAHLADVTKLDGIETHDCFSMSEYMAVDHFGITGPGERED